MADAFNIDPIHDNTCVPQRSSPSTLTLTPNPTLIQYMRTTKVLTIKEKCNRGLKASSPTIVPISTWWHSLRINVLRLHDWIRYCSRHVCIHPVQDVGKSTKSCIDCRYSYMGFFFVRCTCGVFKAKPLPTSPAIPILTNPSFALALG